MPHQLVTESEEARPLLDAGAATDAGTATDAGAATDAGSVVHDGLCETAGFRVGVGQATLGRGPRDPRELRYSAKGPGETYDLFVFSSILRPDEEALASGRYPIGRALEGNAADLLLRAYRVCREVNGNDVCEQTYQADGGILNVISSGGDGERFAVHLENVNFVEMESDGSSLGGRRRNFCGSSLRWDVIINADRPVLGNCLTEGEGSMKGDRLRDLALPNCYGDIVYLHNNCGRVKAQVLVLTAGWCPACRTRLPVTETLIQQYKDQNASVEAYYILGQGSQPGAPATLQECFSDAQNKSIDPARMLVDNGGGRVGFNEMFRRGFATLCDSGLPNYIVLDGDDMSFNFASRCHVSQTDNGVWREDQWGPQDNRAAAGAGGYTLAIEELLND